MLCLTPSWRILAATASLFNRLLSKNQSWCKAQHVRRLWRSNRYVCQTLVLWKSVPFIIYTSTSIHLPFVQNISGYNVCNVRSECCVFLVLHRRVRSIYRRRWGDGNVILMSALSWMLTHRINKVYNDYMSCSIRVYIFSESLSDDDVLLQKRVSTVCTVCNAMYRVLLARNCSVFSAHSVWIKVELSFLHRWLQAWTQNANEFASDGISAFACCCCGENGNAIHDEYSLEISSNEFIGAHTHIVHSHTRNYVWQLIFACCAGMSLLHLLGELYSVVQRYDGMTIPTEFHCI